MQRSGNDSFEFIMGISSSIQSHKKEVSLSKPCNKVQLSETTQNQVSDSLSLSKPDSISAPHVSAASAIHRTETGTNVMSTHQDNSSSKVASSLKLVEKLLSKAQDAQQMLSHLPESKPKLSPLSLSDSLNANASSFHNDQAASLKSHSSDDVQTLHSETAIGIEVHNSNKNSSLKIVQSSASEVCLSEGRLSKANTQTTKFGSGIWYRLEKLWFSVKCFNGSRHSCGQHSEAVNDLMKVESDPALSGDDSKPEETMFHKSRQFEDVVHCFKKTLSVLLIFPKVGAQYRAFCDAAKKTSIKESYAMDSKTALEISKDYSYDIIIIDATNRKFLDAKDLCRKLRAKNPRTVMVAVHQKPYFPCPWKSNSEKMSSYLAAGFNRDFFWNDSVAACCDALLCFEKDVKEMDRYGFLNTLFSAVENCQETIEISNVNHEIQYVNLAYERLLGYNSDDIIGKTWFEFISCDKNSPDLAMKIKQQLDTSTPWEGFCYIKRKSGEQVSNTFRIFPTLESGKIMNFIGIRRFFDQRHNEQRFTIDSPSSSNQSGGSPALEVHNQVAGFRKMSSGFKERLQSITATQSPLSLYSTQNLLNDVILLLSSIKAIPCPQQVYQVIDKACDLLKNSDKATRGISSAIKEDDELINELMDGLMTTSIPASIEDDTRGGRRRSTYYSVSKSASRTMSRTVNGTFIGITPVSLMGAKHSSVIEIRKLLDGVFHWNFNVLKLEELTNKRPLLYAGLKIFQAFDIYTFLNTDAATFKNWLDVIEHNYNAQNPYHNSTHAADVLQAAASLCRRDKIVEIFDDLDVVSTLIAASIHDLDHPGKTNSFLINSGHKLAILYNDVSVLENHHTALAFRLTFKDSSANIFQKVEKDDYRILRQQIIDMVLATDMTKHFDYLNRFNDVIRRPSVDSTPGNSGVKIYPVEFRTVVKRMLIKCCDVSNPTRPLESCIIWAQRIAEEYCRQTDEEKASGLPVVMPVFDRAKCNLPKTQLSFMNLFIVNMMDSWNDFCHVEDLMRNLETNFDYWQQEEPAAKEKVVRVVTTQIT